MLMLIRRNGQLIDISPDGVNVTPEAVISLLHPHLSYEHVRFQTGWQSLQECGEYQEQFKYEPRILYYFDAGRLVTFAGLIARVYHVLRQAGYDVRYIDVSPPSPRPTCYAPDWPNVYRHFWPFVPAAGIQLGAFRPRQEEVLSRVAASRTGIVSACTGFGKTFVFTALCLLYPQAKIDIVVKPTEVADRLFRQIGRYVSSTGMCGGGRRTTGRVTIYTADSMHYSYGDADFVLGDECHLLTAETYFAELAKYRHARVFGFTATTEGRKDGTDLRIEGMFGPIIFKLTYPEAVALGLVVPMHVRWLRVRMDENPGAGCKNAIERERRNIWFNSYRNGVLVNDIRSRGGDSQLLVMCRTLQHAIQLQAMLPDFELCYGGVSPEKLAKMRLAGVVPDWFVPITTARREQLRAAFEAGHLRKAIATDVWATGVDFEQLAVLYRADARDSRILDVQLPGRPARLFSGKARGELVDMYDTFDKTLADRSRRRRDAYAELGFTQEWPTWRV